MNMKFMLLGMTAVASLPLIALTATSASAAMPVIGSDHSAGASLVEKARSNCTWVDNKWTYQKGDKRLVCRPNRPAGKGWGWHREGNRTGWFHAGRKAWHNQAW
ncbi:MAG: hypothetical protein ACKVP7_29320 [Hyphomicrobiaceae bacterium]